MEKLKQFWHKDGTRSVMASLLSILIGLAVGFVVLLVLGGVVCFFIDSLSMGGMAGNILALLNLHKVHLQAHNINLTTTLLQTLNLCSVAWLTTIVVDVESNLLREILLSPLQRLIRIVAIHNTITTLCNWKFLLDAVCKIILVTLIHYVPAMYATFVSLCDLLDTIFERLVQRLWVVRESLSTLLEGHIAPFVSVLLLASESYRILIREILFPVCQFLRREHFTPPTRHSVTTRTPHENVTMHLNTLLLAELYNLIG